MKAQYMDHMGSDASVVNAARVSFDKLADMFTPEQNESLIYFLARGVQSREWEGLKDQICHTSSLEDAEKIIQGIRHQAEHWTPFAHTAITLRMGAPVPLRTQAFKHKVGLTENEESRRYISTRPEIFVPDFRAAPEGSIKQGSAGPHEHAAYWKGIYERKTTDMVDTYLTMIEDGVCPEQARFILPQGAIVNWIWTGNLYAFANYFIKRTDSHAQQEGQDIAHMVGEIIEPLFPVCWKALTQ